MIYAGLRFRVQGQLAGKVYAGPFGLDVAFGDVLTEPPETPCSLAAVARGYRKAGPGNTGEAHN